MLYLLIYYWIGVIFGILVQLSGYSTWVDRKLEKWSAKYNIPLDDRDTTVKDVLEIVILWPVFLPIVIWMLLT